VENVLVSADGLSAQRLDSSSIVRVSRSRYVAKFLRSNPDGDFYSSVGNRLGLQTM
jgi:NAD kinase